MTESGSHPIINPQDEAPKFHTFLQQAGEVTYGEEVREVHQLRLRRGSEPHVGAETDVLLDGEVLGAIKIFKEPPVIIFQGRIPNTIMPKRRIKPKYTNNGITTSIMLSSHGEHPMAVRVGRNDGWKIPFP